ncbi:hypothetical protein [Caballeronia hypogeia]|nr:hypothetical protein [Caballeronia hypogeia]
MDNAIRVAWPEFALHDYAAAAQLCGRCPARDTFDRRRFARACIAWRLAMSSGSDAYRHGRYRDSLAALDGRDRQRAAIAYVR